MKNICDLCERELEEKLHIIYTKIYDDDSDTFLHYKRKYLCRQCYNKIKEISKEVATHDKMSKKPNKE